MPTVKLTTNVTNLIETESTIITFRFELDEPPPSGGVRVYLKGNVPQSLTQLDLPAINIQGGNSIEGDFDFTGFYFNIESQVGTVSAPIFADGIAEGQQSVVYTLQPGTGYTVDPTASAIAVNFFDDPSQVSPPPNDPPVAVNDSYTTNAATELIIDVGNGVLNNDTDAQSDPLTAQVVQAPSNGILTLNANGAFNYTPNAGFSGIDSFTYLANDTKADSTAATVSITVNSPPPPPNDPPVAVNDSYTTNAATELIIDVGNGVLNNDTDAQSDPLTAQVVQAPSNGILTLNANGAFNYTPNAGFSGTDSFTYLANDTKADSTAATASITVNPPPNDPPIAVNDSYTTNAATELIIDVGNGVLNNDTDAQSDPLTAQVVQAPSNGILTLNANGAFNYTPNAGFSGTDSFTYLANDTKADSTAATASITVNPPPASIPTISFTASPTTLVEANNDNIVLTFQLSEPPPEAGLEVTFDSGVERSLAEFDVFSASFNGARLVTANSISSGVTIRLLQQTATIALPLFPDEVVEGLETFTYTLSPVPGYDFVPGENAITFTINDTATPPPNDPPVAVNDSYTTNAATELIIDVGNGVLNNDTDAQSDPLTAQVVQAPSNGILTLNANGAFNYTPNAGFSGTDSFTYLANDTKADSTAATASITVNPPPASIPTISFTASPTTLVEANNDNIVLTFQLSEPPPEAGLEVTFDSGVERSLAEFDVFSASFNGARLVTANSISSGVTIRLLQQTATIALPLFPDEVVEGLETFTYTLSPVPGYDFVPGENAITFTINDTATPPPNDPPVAVNDSYTTNAATELIIDVGNGVLNNDTDAQSDPLTAQVVQAPSNGILTLNANGAFNYTPNAGFSGTDSFTYLANDTKADSTAATASITVNPPPNDPPIAVNDSYTTNAATELIIDVGNGVLNNDTDAQSDPLTAQVVQAPSNGILTLNANGAFNYTPNAGFSGTDSFTYLANDTKADSTAATASITVNPPPASIPTISFTASPTTLVEANNDNIVLTFQLSEPPPEAGLEVTFDSGVERSLAEFDVFSASFNGARLVTANSISSGVTIRLLQQTATIALPLFPDEVVEGLETFTYTLSPVPGYDFVPGEDAITFTINDTATPPPILPAINRLSDSVFQLEGSDQPKLQISLIERNSNQVNELGAFIVDDDKGTINGIEPNSTGYAQAALDRAELIFSAISNSPTGFNQTNSTSLLELNSEDKLGFLLVENSTIDAVRSGVTSLSEVVFAEPSTQKVETLGDGSYLISWEAAGGNSVPDFKDLVVKASATNQSLPLGAGLQGNPQGELIDLRDITGQVRAEFGLHREAAFDNLTGFYKVADADGGIDADGNGSIDIRPGDSGYAKAAIQGRVAGLDLTVNNQGTATFTTNLNGGSIYAPFIIANGKPEAILDDNPNNDPAVHFAFLGANPSKYDHIRLLGNNTWGFEDSPLGGDKDYNDVIVQANFNLI